MKNRITIIVCFLVSIVTAQDYAIPKPEKKIKTLQLMIPILPADADYAICANGQTFTLYFENVIVRYNGRVTLEEVVHNGKFTVSDVLEISRYQDLSKTRLEDTTSKVSVIRAARDPLYSLADFATFQEVELYYKTYQLTSKSDPKEKHKILMLYARPKKQAAKS